MEHELVESCGEDGRGGGDFRGAHAVNAVETPDRGGRRESVRACKRTGAPAAEVPRDGGGDGLAGAK